MLESKYHDYVERIVDFKVKKSMLETIKALREYFGMSRGLKELRDNVEYLRVIEKTGVLASNKMDFQLYQAVRAILTSTIREYNIFEGSIDSGYDEHWPDEEVDCTSEADNWYASLSEEHQAFVDQLIWKNQIGPAQG